MIQLSMPRRQALRLISASIGVISMSAWANWPDKPIKLIVTFPPGGASDIVARVVAEQLGRKLGQPVVVDNRPGAGGTIGGSAVAQSPADGNTFMLSNSTPIALGPFTLEKQPYDPVEAFTHVASLGSAPLIVMSNPQAGINTIADLENTAKKSGLLNFGSGGPGSIGHIYGELMKKSMGINMVHVPYRGGAPMTTDLISGVIPVGMDVITAYVPFFKSGQLRPLAVTTATRSPLMPEVPTMMELGYKNLSLENFFGLSGPAKLPADIVTRMNAVCNEILVMPEVKSKLLELGITAVPVSSGAFTKLVKDQVNVLAPLVKSAGIKL